MTISSSFQVPLRRAVESTGMAGRDLPGFCRPKGVGPFVPVFLAGLMNGESSILETAFRRGNLTRILSFSHAHTILLPLQVLPNNVNKEL